MKLAKRILPILIGLAAFGWTWEWTKAPREPREGIRVTLTMRSDVSDEIELFYDSVGSGFHTESSVRRKLVAGTEPQDLSFDLPRMDSLHGLRLDPGDNRVTVELHSIRFEGPYRSRIWDARDILEHFTVFHEMDTAHYDPTSRSVHLPCTGFDPFITTGDDIASALRGLLSPIRPVLLAFVKAALAGILAGVLMSFLLTLRLPRREQSRRSWSVPAAILVLCATAALAYAVFSFISGIRILDRDKEILIVGTWHHADDVQIYYSERPDDFDKYHYASRSVVANKGPQLARITFSSGTNLRYLRFDPGMDQDTVWLDSLRLSIGSAHTTWHPEGLKERFVANEHVAAVDIVDDRLRLITNGNDPFFRITEDVGPTFVKLNKRSGNGPLPYVLAGIVALFFLVGSGRALSKWVQRPDLGHADLSIAIVFAVLISIPMLTMITDTEPVLQNTEKRQLAERPEFELHRALDFPVEYTTYFAENFGLRKLFFRWNSIFHAYVLNTSPLPERTLFGKDGFMFYMREGTLEKYQNICDISDKDLEMVATRLELRRQWLSERGIRYVLMVPPEKSAIYGDKLPDRIHKFDTPSCLDKLLLLLNQNSRLEVVDIRDTLLEARKKHEVYYDVDTHWNPIGAWYGYKELMRVLSEGDTAISPPKPFKDFDIHPELNEDGDLAVMIGLNDLFIRNSPVMVPKDSLLARDVPIGSFAKSGFFKYTPITKEIQGSTAPRILVFRDSFSVYMIPSISEHFSHSTYVWTPIFIPQVVIEERPDIVVHEVMELYLSDLLQDDLALPPSIP